MFQCAVALAMNFGAGTAAENGKRPMSVLKHLRANCADATAIHLGSSSELLMLRLS